MGLLRRGFWPSPKDPDGFIVMNAAMIFRRPGGGRNQDAPYVLNARKFMKKEGVDRSGIDLRYPEEVRMDFICRVLRLARSLFVRDDNKKEPSNDTRLVKSI